MPRNHAFYKPNTVQIELVQGCNRRCSFCGTMGIEHKLHFIKQKVLKRECELIAQSGYKPRILIAGHGENTLHPHFIECIKLIRSIIPDACIQILTNGYSIKQDYNNIVSMFEAGINDISIDEYKDSRFDYDKIKSVAEEYNYTVEILGNKGVNFYTPKSSSVHRILIVPPIDESETKTLTRVLNDHCGAAMPPDSSLKNKTCVHVFRELVFRWDGWVNICCNDFRGEFRIANCMDSNINSFDDLWRHEVFEAARRVLYHKKRIFFPCSVCNARSLRAGLIPDYKGQETMEEPTKEDIKLCRSRFKLGSLAVLQPRKWELEAGKFTNGDVIDVDNS